MNKKAFREGFLCALAQNGITPRDLGRHCMQKQALFQIELGDNIGEALSGIGRGLTTVFVDAPVAATIGAAGLGGLGGAYLLHQTDEALTEDEKEVQKLKNKELARQIRLRNLILKRKLRKK